MCGDGPAGSRLCSPEGAPAAAWLEAVPCLPPLPGRCRDAPEDGDGGRRGAEEDHPRFALNWGVAGLPGGGNSHREKPRGGGGVSSSPRLSRYARFSWVSKVSGEVGMPSLPRREAGAGQSRGFGRAGGGGASGKRERQRLIRAAGSTQNT